MARYKTVKHRVKTKSSVVLRKRMTQAAIAPLRDKLAKKQNYVCPICQRDLRKLQQTLDHCHETGHPRGTLCNNCNGLEGKLNGFLKRIDVANIGTEQIIQNLARHRHPSNLKKKFIHPNVETLFEQRDRQKRRAKVLYEKKRKLKSKMGKL